MNISGWIRGMMAKSYRVDRFFELVIDCIVKELEEWEHDTMILYDWDAQNPNVNITFIIDLSLYTMQMSKTDIEQRKNQGPFSLDRTIWRFLERKGIKLRDDQYIRYVYGIFNVE